MKEYIVETRSLKKYYQMGENTVKALDGVDFRVKDQEFVAIIGKSGSGKSTLLHMLGGLDVPTEGEVLVEGKCLLGMKKEQLAIFRRRKIGFIFQNYNLVPDLNVYENVILPVELDGRKVGWFLGVCWVVVVWVVFVVGWGVGVGGGVGCVFVGVVCFLLVVVGVGGVLCLLLFLGFVFVVFVLCVLCVLGGCGFGGWWWLLLVGIVCGVFVFWLLGLVCGLFWLGFLLVGVGGWGVVFLLCLVGFWFFLFGLVFVVVLGCVGFCVFWWCLVGFFGWLFVFCFFGVL